MNKPHFFKERHRSPEAKIRVRSLPRSSEALLQGAEQLRRERSMWR